MAAHLEGKGASVLDFTGFAQKFGPVLSYIRLAADARGDQPGPHRPGRRRRGHRLRPRRVAPRRRPRPATGRARASSLNTAEMPTGDVVRLRDAEPARRRRARRRSRACVGAGEPRRARRQRARPSALLGDSVFANVMMLGFAWQQGLVPVSLRGARAGDRAERRARSSATTPPSPSAGCSPRRAGGASGGRPARAPEAPRRSTS